MTLRIRDAATEDIDFLAAMLLEAFNWREDRQPATLQAIMDSPDRSRPAEWWSFSTPCRSVVLV
ncbi:hypothetical protein JF66_20630 [Cryobacterium sp. MLB-32]|uniref:hypothetical protein n=1 Tax=Cryobacterium sp. MLB-32 TaxID=1529318 RepID=UPI0004E6EF48|nr:hypothetical protein [Cryobacterium sp. MLB-32]KFF58166.1 hypothetical protein JF66_20630 [Cryobacterium sp. MLB-32]